MRRLFRRGAATAALLALVCGGVAVTPAIATEIEDTPVTALEDATGQPDGSLQPTVEGDSADPAVVDGVDAQEVDSGALVVDELVEPDSSDDGEYAGGHVSAVVPEGPGAPTLPAPPSEGGSASVEELVVVEFDIVSLAISGVAQVGQTLTSAVEFSLTPDYVEFQWFADDELIKGAESETLSLTEDLIGTVISLGVYAEHEDFEFGVEAYSNDLGPVTAVDSNEEQFEVLSVVISGTPKVGQTITAVAKFSHAPDSVGYLWFADDELIEGVEGDTLLLTKDLIGKTIVLGVYGLHEDFEEPAVGVSNEFGPVTAAAVVIVDTGIDKQVEKVTQQAQKPAPKSSTGELAQTGADVTGVVLAGLSFMLLGLGGVWLRRRATQS